MKTACERFWEKVIKTEDCWLWQASTNKGYGQFTLDGTMVSAHRFAYEELVGKIPDGLVLDHKCRNRACVNPEHLEAVTQQVNVLRGEGVGAVHAKKTHCPKGHEYTEENTTLYRNKRYCKACKREAMRLYRLKKKQEAENG